MSTTTRSSTDTDRLRALKAGVKGLVDAGVTAVPAIFHHPPDNTPTHHLTIPVLNHGVPEEAMSEVLAAVRRFNEEPAEARAPYYTRDHRRRVRFNSNFDLFQSPAANWRDTLLLEMAPEPPSPEQIPSRPPAAHVQRQCYGPSSARYRSTTVEELLREYRAKGLDGTSALHHFRL
ncbi:hypothetical protein CFC21_100945 [Triticum aestivum]|uniref:Non-haem dioxygenase N-terminal domain-containing protein n=2 Tax=Triticum aestivum TaxID=4565 RepID=A0A9R1M228_WHEAT|nr:hypothetical protein CFC21_100945 [Triticum aestivum]